MSTNPLHYGSGSVVSGRTGFTHTGSPRPARPGQLAPGIVEGIAGGADPGDISDMCHASAAALLNRVHQCEDPAIVARVLTLVEHEGVDMIAELWSQAEPDSLPGVLWRLYLLRSWMRTHRESIARLWRAGEPVATSASAIVGVDTAPTEDDIARIADSILAGAFTGDFAVALERAAAFTDVVALGIRVEVHRMSAGGGGAAGAADGAGTAGTDDRSTGSTGAAAADGAAGAADGSGKADRASTAGGTGGTRRDPDRASQIESSGDTAKPVGGTGDDWAGAGIRPAANDAFESSQAKRRATQAARLLHTAGNLFATAKDFRHGAALWRRGKLE